MYLYRSDGFNCPFREVLRNGKTEVAKGVEEKDTNAMEIDPQTEPNRTDINKGLQQNTVLAEAIHLTTRFFSERGDHTYLQQWWDWTPLWSLFRDASYIPNHNATSIESLPWLLNPETTSRLPLPTVRSLVFRKGGCYPPSLSSFV